MCKVCVFAMLQVPHNQNPMLQTALEAVVSAQGRIQVPLEIVDEYVQALVQKQQQPNDDRVQHSPCTWLSTEPAPAGSAYSLTCTYDLTSSEGLTAYWEHLQNVRENCWMRAAAYRLTFPLKFVNDSMRLLPSVRERTLKRNLVIAKEVHAAKSTNNWDKDQLELVASKYGMTPKVLQDIAVRAGRLTNLYATKNVRSAFP